MAKVVLLHGLYMHGTVMWPLARRLEKLGWETECLSYNSVAIEPEALFDRLSNALPHDQPNYFIGHSLGGVMLYHYAHQRALTVDSRIVTLGSPLQGAAIAKRLAEWGLSALMGNAGEHGLLNGDCLRWRSPAALGSLAGRSGLGVGALLGALNEPSDGTVAVSETEVEGMADHIILPTTHTSMLLAEQTAVQCDHFLRHGQFQASACS
ncbi:esterase/lipase family protein [Ferrimonas marina]|uniref:Alpha/beta hydrolase family protein n=1 Tax=Ferrimonas marina TaxID=299255 RepID=A0A1M5ZGP3_9GAMM|nr:hypothetical protein [Ferrimonas marina]SHI23073.1 hypothetical protein SAMN02745129_0244 [Ferrimonas marina]